MPRLQLREGESVRPGRESDVPECARILQEWLESAAEMVAGQNYDPNDDHEAFLRSVLKAEDETMFVAKDSDGVQGFVTLRAHRRRNRDLIGRVGNFARNILSRAARTGQQQNVGIVDHIVMREGKRTTYMTLALLHELTEWCQQRGLRAIEGTIWADNKAMLRLGEYLGYRPVRVLVRKELS